ncbi:hypothetical protein MKEN_01148500 [Mycena kentingensis (nom. inval.)]|nr:hypothetical protein MKEN_01148500 [Mycena kentingensis (nom. inval.)]
MKLQARGLCPTRSCDLHIVVPRLAGPPNTARYSPAPTADLRSTAYSSARVYKARPRWSRPTALVTFSFSLPSIPSALHSTLHDPLMSANDYYKGQQYQGGYYPGPQQPPSAYQGGYNNAQQYGYPQNGYQPTAQPQTIYVQQQPQKGSGGGGCMACLAGACLCCCAEEVCLDCCF